MGGYSLGQPGISQCLLPGETNWLFTFIADFDDSMFVKTSTPYEWIIQGDYYAKHQCWKVRSRARHQG